MSRDLVRRPLTRRSMLGLGLGAAALPILAACGQAAAPTATTAPAAAAPTTAPAAKPTTAPAAAAPTTAPAAAAQPTVAPTAAAAAAPKPAASIKINGNLAVIQQRGFNPLQTTYIHDLLVKTADANGWPLDHSYEEGFTGGGNFLEKM